LKNVLVVYPHGLGDCILLTPALREFYKKTGNKLHIATLERFATAKFFDNNPYIDKILYTKDAWHDYSNPHLGFNSIYNEWKQYAKDNSMSGIVMPMHSEPKNKILINFRALGIGKESSPQTEIHATPGDKKIAEEIVQNLVGNNEFGFVQTSTGVPTKDLPENFGREWLKDNKGLKHIIEVGKEIDSLEYNINIQFEILRLAKAVCIPDSVFYHACHAMNKDVDFVYFGRGEKVYNRVRPLCEVNENVVYKI